ncbi:MAG TPA: alpha/beta hydrolase [Paludibacter sp.]|nr:alpha/beta hydrolase [Paludibacter sp.]
MKRALIPALILVLSFSQMNAQIYLWQKGNMPNSKGLHLADSIANDRQFVVADPNIEVYTPSKEENRGFAVLVIPGGGYARLAHVVSGSQIAKYINSIGGTAFVLKYRLPVSPDLKQRELGPLQDGQRAIKMMRALAPKYGYSPNKIGVFGTSAGGHLASSLGVYTEDYTEVKDTLYKYSFQPDFMVLLSPVIMLADPYAHKGSRENLLGKNASEELINRFSTQLHVTAQTPPTILFHANDDKSVPSLNSVFFYTSLREKGVDASLHIFPHGGHAINLTKSPGSTVLWMPILDAWLKETGIYDMKIN